MGPGIEPGLAPIAFKLALLASTFFTSLDNIDANVKCLLNY